MPSAAELYELAVRAHQQGRLTEAEALLREVLQADGRHAWAYHLLGVLAHMANRQDAVSFIRQASALEPTIAVFHYNLGCIYKHWHQLDEAAACFRQALRSSRATSVPTTTWA